MNTLQYTTTGSLFNHTGILQHAGDYAGQFQNEAYEIIESYHKKDLESITNDFSSWCDIMHDNKGTCYAVAATDELTCQNANCIYIELEKADCEKAWKNAQTHIN